MLIAVMADLHANREAVAACLAHAREQGATRHVFLGDYVGYGADPVWVVETVLGHVEAGACAVLGNHDHAVAEPAERMNADAARAIAWTRGQLGPRARAFLAELPLAIEAENRLYVHSWVPASMRWRYVEDSEDATQCLRATDAWATFCGHVHVPALYGIAANAALTRFEPVPGIAVPLPRQRRWLAVLGSVGQPRDGNPAAAYALLDIVRAEITFQRVPYDVDLAAEKIRRAGLPAALAARLATGR